MKKFIIPLLAVMLFGGIANAQTSVKKPVKATTQVSSKPAVKKTTTTTVTPAQTTHSATVVKTTPPIRRRHHHKPTKSKHK